MSLARQRMLMQEVERHLSQTLFPPASLAWTLPIVEILRSVHSGNYCPSAVITSPNGNQVRSEAVVNILRLHKLMERV